MTTDSHRAQVSDRFVFDDEIDLRALLVMLKNNRRFIAIVMAVMFTLAFLYTHSIPNQYSSSALIQVDNGGGGR